MNKVYLGDAVYMNWTNNGDLELTTEDGVEVTNRIFLDPSVLQSLLYHIELRKKKS